MNSGSTHDAPTAGGSFGSIPALSSVLNAHTPYSSRKSRCRQSLRGRTFMTYIDVTYWVT